MNINREDEGEWAGIRGESLRGFFFFANYIIFYEVDSRSKGMGLIR